MPAIVDLEEAVAVTAVADDVVPGVAARAAGLLGGDGGQQIGIEAVAAGRARRSAEAKATPAAARREAIGSMLMAASIPPPARV